jgi:hypothetical protein
MKYITVFSTLVLLFLLGSLVLANESTTIDRYVICGGGGHVDISPYTLDGTLGQAVVGLDSLDPFQLCSGFQCRAVYEIYLPLVLRVSS